MNISLQSTALQPLMFGKGFIKGVQASRHVHNVNISNGMPVVVIKRPIIDKIRRRSSRKLEFGQK